MKTTYTPSQPPACSKAATPSEASVAEALARGDLLTLPRVGGPTHASGLMEILLGAYDRLARELNEHPERSGTATASPHHGGSQVGDPVESAIPMKMVMSDSSGPPPGIYTGALTEVKPTTSAEYGPGVCFTWTVDSGEHAGAKTSRTGKPTPTGQNITGRLINGLLGRQMKAGEEIDIQSFIGKRFTLVVGMSPSGKSTRVESCLPMQ